jgi:hypothetical protein
MIDDRFYPGGAREALETCQRIGASLLVGPWGQDQIVAAARWAEDHRIPYLHGSAAEEDVDELTWSASLSPTDDDLMRMVARTMVSDVSGSPVFGIVRIDSRYYESGETAFARALGDLGYELSFAFTVQKDESLFDRAWRELQRNGVTHVVLHVSAKIAGTMLSQKPLLYDPSFASVEPSIATQAVASQMPEEARFTALHDPGPPFVPSDLQRSELPWFAQIQEFETLFNTYSPEQQPPMDSFDWDSYLRAKQIHRFLDALDGNLSPEHVRAQFSTFADGDADVFPTCPLDFSSHPDVGTHASNVSIFEDGRWALRAGCTEDGPDLGAPTVVCEDAVPVRAGSLSCEAIDAFSGVAGISGFDQRPPFPPSIFGVITEPCSTSAKFAIDLSPGLHLIQINTTDCAGNDGSFSTVVVSI